MKMKNYVYQKLSESQGQLRQVARDLEIPYPTLLKIHQRVIINPGIDHMQNLHDYFKSKEAKEVTA